jgi:nitroreductase
MSTETATALPFLKLAETDAAIHDLIRSRWSPRAFSDRNVSNEDLKSVLEAARWAASSYNEQPWRFFVVRKSDGEAYQRVFATLAPANQAWAARAPVLIIMAAKKSFSHNGAPNYYALHDAGQALAHLMLQATALGLHAHGMAGFNHEKAREVIGIPDDYDIGAAVVLGYAGDPDQLAEQTRKMELAKRQRRPLSEIAFGSRWNEPLTL